jgi:hypothetical protein
MGDHANEMHADLFHPLEDTMEFGRSNGSVDLLQNDTSSLGQSKRNVNFDFETNEDSSTPTRPSNFEKSRINRTQTLIQVVTPLPITSILLIMSLLMYLPQILPLLPAKPILPTSRLLLQPKSVLLLPTLSILLPTKSILLPTKFILPPSLLMLPRPVPMSLIKFTLHMPMYPTKGTPMYIQILMLHQRSITRHVMSIQLPAEQSDYNAGSTPP